MVFISIILSVITGLAMALQSPTNAALGKHVGTLQASLTNFVVGVVLCWLLVLTVGSGDITKVVGVPFWQLLGGLYGVCIIVALVIATPKLGVVLMVTMTMLGQLLAGLLIDTAGLAGVEPTPLSMLRIVGCVLVAAGIFCVHTGNKTGSVAALETKKMLGYMCLPFFGGFVSTLQPPTNAALSATVGSFEASCVNFTVGFLILLIVVLVTSRGKVQPYAGTKPWQFFGGAYGVFGVVLATMFSPVLGMSLWMAGTMLGQLLGGMTIDTFGLLHLPRIKVNRYRVVGALLIMAGIVVVTVGKLG